MSKVTKSVAIYNFKTEVVPDKEVKKTELQELREQVELLEKENKELKFMLGQCLDFADKIRTKSVDCVIRSLANSMFSGIRAAVKEKVSERHYQAQRRNGNWR
jgi:predicted nuclease with TOPRIM domain